MEKKIFTTLLILLPFLSQAQNKRISDPNAIGWFGLYTTNYIAPKTSLWVEYQWRRENFVTDWQQSLLRTGIQRHFTKNFSAMLGYGWIVSFPYGDYPGRFSFPEHRIFEQATWTEKLGRVAMNHRFRLEQRWLGQLDPTSATKHIKGYAYLNRIRYQLKATIPFNGNTVDNKEFYCSPYDELFIGFGKNVQQNVFDQNRFGLLFGYQMSDAVRLEMGYLNQILQQAALVDGNNIIQYNHGIIVNLNVSNILFKS